MAYEVTIFARRRAASAIVVTVTGRAALVWLVLRARLALVIPVVWRVRRAAIYLAVHAAGHIAACGASPPLAIAEYGIVAHPAPCPAKVVLTAVIGVTAWAALCLVVIAGKAVT